MNEWPGFIICGIIGFVLGGLLGVYLDHGFFPDCFYGMLVAWGAIGGCLFIDLDFDW